MTFIPQTIAILGRQPALGLAELEAIYSSDCVRPFGNHALLSIETSRLDISRIGGTLRFAKIICEITGNWRSAENQIIDATLPLCEEIDGKITFGLSVFDVPVHKKDIARTALNLKKEIKRTGRSVRMVAQDNTQLNSASVLYNKLTGPQGLELIVVTNGKQTYLAQTTAIQDIDAYTARDRERPFRDAKVGMLPPKLAQIIINLSLSDTQNATSLLLDPFCGTGVVLQEAMLMDLNIYGSDIDPRMVQYSIDNLVWLDTLYPDNGDYRRVEIGDATTHQWNNPSSISNVACETYLGKPLSSLPPSDQLSKIMTEVNTLHHKFLQNLGNQIKSRTRLCLAIPAWRGKHEFLHLKMLDYLEEIGYNRVKFKHVENAALIYHRDGQVVARELLVLIKK